MIDRSPLVVEINWLDESAGSISLDRNEFFLNEAGIEMLNKIKVSIEKFYKEFLKENKGSVFHMLNCSILARKSDFNLSKFNWLNLHKDEEERFYLKWGELTFPCINWTGIGLEQLKKLEASWRSESIRINPDLSTFTKTGGTNLYSWNSIHIPPQKLVFEKNSSKKLPIRGLWTTEPDSTNVTKLGNGFSCIFPPIWEHIVGVNIYYFSRKIDDTFIVPNLWNKSNPLVESCLYDYQPEQFQKKCLFDDNFQRTSKFYSSFGAVLPFPNLQRMNKSKLDTWIILLLSQFLNDNQQLQWNQRVIDSKDYFQKMWKILFPEGCHKKDQWKPIYFVGGFGTARNGIHVIGPEGWIVEDDPNKVSKLLPEPSPEWTIEILEK